MSLVSNRQRKAYWIKVWPHAGYVSSSTGGLYNVSVNKEGIKEPEA